MRLFLLFAFIVVIAHAFPVDTRHQKTIVFMTQKNSDSYDEFYYVKNHYLKKNVSVYFPAHHFSEMDPESGVYLYLPTFDENDLGISYFRNYVLSHYDPKHYNLMIVIVSSSKTMISDIFINLYQICKDNRWHITKRWLM